MLSLSGQWVLPAVIGDCPLPSSLFTLTALTDDTFIMFCGTSPNGITITNSLYIGHCTKSVVVSVFLLTTPTIAYYGCGLLKQ